MKTTELTKTYGKKTVLNIPALAFEKGKIYALIGGNGSGKSTLAKLLAGIIRANEKDRIHREPRELIRYMPQKSYAFRLRVRKNVLLSGGDKDRAETLIEALGLEPLARQKGHKLSEGEAARMALARILMRPCDLLIIDEPTAAMDMQSTQVAESLVAKYRDETGCAVLWITHSLTQAQRVADNLLFLHEGRLCASGTLTETLSAPDNPELKQFLDFYKFS